LMKRIGAFEAKTHLSELLDLAAVGERIMITRRGKPVAMLVPAVEDPALTPSEAAASLRMLRRGVTLGGLSVRDLVEEGRR
jgi:prevent-host-death family protein